jgi:signal transduction histidine kinase
MDSSTVAAGPNRGKRPSPPRWYRLLYLLAAFALFTVALSLFLSHQYLGITIRSVAVSRAWAERLQICARLGQLAAGVNAPGNDVFQSQRAENEEAKLRAALRVFDNEFAAFRDELRRNAAGEETAPLVDDLQSFGRSVHAMADEAGILFTDLRADRTRQAGRRMAVMDRHYAHAIQALEGLRGKIVAVQIRHLEDQTDAAAVLQRFQYVVSALILLLLGGAVLAARRLRRRVEAANREKEGYIQALRHSEATLEGRVRERTADLVRSNEALRRSERRARALMRVRRRLLKRVLSAQEDERRRIARDLHDEIGQALTSLLIGLRTVADAPTCEAARGRANELRQVTVNALEEVRRLARGLRPSVLDDLGLAAALERYAADYARAHTVAVEVRVPDAAAGRLPDEVETALYRIAQEALTNTARHAAARHVVVAVERRPGVVQLTVADDGRGFARGKADPGGRLGLPGVRERAALLNGSVAVESGPGAGTTVTVRIPCAEENHGADSRAAGR